MSEHTLEGSAAELNSKPWLASYPPGVTPEIGPDPYQSITDLLEKNCVKYADRTAFTSMGKGLTYRQLDEMTGKIGAWLQAQGLQKGDRVAVMLPNILQNPVISYGILRAGFVVVNVNPLYTAPELEYQLKDSGAKALFTLENFAHTVQKAVGKTQVQHIVVATMGDMLGLKGHIVNLVVRKVKKMVPAFSLPSAISFKKVVADAAKHSLRPVSLSSSDIAFLQYTGGTTGVSKGAVLTHGNLLANRAQIEMWLNSNFATRERPEVINFVCALPLYHIFALTVNSLMGVALGANNYMIANPRDIPAFVKELATFKPHIFPGLNTLFNAMMNNEDFKKLDFSSLLFVLGGGMAVQRPVAERWYELTGCPITEGYGLSETSPVATVNRLDAVEFSGTIGLPLPSTEISIRDDDGSLMPSGEVGEICIKGPQVMAGYWQRPDETAKVMTSDGFFRSGDMGYMDAAGYTKIVDRKKDMILVSGFNVYPNEVEEVAVGHPGVLEAAAVGIADEHSGEIVKLFVVKKDPLLTEADVKEFCAKSLTNYKRPKIIQFIDEMPKTNVGKILRRELRNK
jgi:long-chain acyl-CoA synthetase